jgi:rubrerythrin
MKVKTFWRCPICGDLHYGVEAPELCPTCHTPRAKHVKITKEEFLKAFQ